MTPKPYLSYSQKRLWQKSPREYLEKYLYGKEQYITREMAYGKRMADALENDQDDADPALNVVRAALPKLDQQEFEVNALLRIEKERIHLYGKLDTALISLKAFKEYKTGKEPWTQKKVDDDKQITFYCTMIFLLFKFIPDDIELVWAQTRNDPDAPGGITSTGVIKTFRTHRKMGQIINEMAEIKRVWREINEACDKELLA